MSSAPGICEDGGRCAVAREFSLGRVPGSGEFLTRRQVRQLVWAFLLLGLAGRAIRYLLCFPFWNDECFLCANLTDRGYAELLKPLDYHQVAPVFYLWLQLTIVKVLGFSELSLRLYSFVCSVGSLFLFRHLTSRLLRGSTQVLAMSLFAVSYAGIRYATEAKPYGGDLFVSLVLLSLAVEYGRRPGRILWLWLLCAVTPFAMALSYPAMFVGGGISLWLAYSLWQQGTCRGWLAWSLFNLMLVGSFGGVMLLSAPQREAELEWMRGFWDETFPPLSSPGLLLSWLVTTHTGNLFGYPMIGTGAGAPAFLCCLVAVVLLVRDRRFGLVLFCVAPLALTFIAACMRRYPYGSLVRLNLYMMPLICLMTGIGAAAMLRRLAGRTRYLPGMTCAVLLTLASLVVGLVGRDFLMPYKHPPDQLARGFSQWFWFTAAKDGEVACLDADFHLQLVKGLRRGLNGSAEYLCYQRMYSPPRVGPNWVETEGVSAEMPLRCVQYQPQGYPINQKACDQWLSRMQRHYDLVSRERFLLPHEGKKGESRWNDYLLVYKFMPRKDRADTSPTAAGGD